MGSKKKKTGKQPKSNQPGDESNNTPKSSDSDLTATVEGLSGLGDSSSTDIEENKQTESQQMGDVLVDNDVKEKGLFHEPDHGQIVQKRNPYEKIVAVAEDDPYNRERKNSFELKKMMKATYDQAIAAKDNGDRQEAKRLHNEVAKLKAKAKAEQQRASAALFNQSNADIKNEMEVNLHCQHVEEAMFIVKKHIGFAKKYGTIAELVFIIGVGSHGTGKPKILDEVVKLLDAEKLPWKFEDNNKGRLRITFDRK